MRTRNNLLRYLATLLLALALCLPPPPAARAAGTEETTPPGTAWVHLENTGRWVDPSGDDILGEFALGLPEGLVYQAYSLQLYRIVDFAFVDGNYQASWVRGTDSVGWAYEFFQQSYSHYDTPGELAKASYDNQREVWDALASYLYDQAFALSILAGVDHGKVGEDGAFPSALSWCYTAAVTQGQTQVSFTNVPLGQYLCLTNNVFIGFDDPETDPTAVKKFTNHPLSVTILPQAGADGQWYLHSVRASLKGTNIGLNRWVDQDQVGTGDVVSFGLEVKVPRYQFRSLEGSEEHDVLYTGNRDFSLTEVLSPGFTLLEDTVELEPSLPPGSYTQQVTRRADGSAEIRWDFAYDLIGEQSEITLSYQAQVNEAMAVGSDENTAAATLTYVKSIAAGDFAGEQDTITETLHLWTYGMTLIKADGTTITAEDVTNSDGVVIGTRPAAGENTKYLAGAVFRLSRQIGVFSAASQDALKENPDYLSAVFENQENGQLYTLPIYKADGKTVDGYGLYLSMKDFITNDTPEGLSLTGLDTGTYLLEEILAPQGYNRLTQGIRFTIPDVPLPDGEEHGKRASLKTFTDDYGQESLSGSYVLLVANYRGVQLPETGGVGTAGLTQLGLLLMAAAMFVFHRGRPLENKKK